MSQCGPETGIFSNGCRPGPHGDPRVGQDVWNT
ncbi:hypothetical protein STRAU_5244 [Streptomyces aurantiacus JA 4570]|uniref:Uncharacterized protein n=1 Tax=Streptomyces aurantiacus JA 4570 TaxID=1286094 RepID=S4AJQ1_9ACTN|nr:hypothetical protein STRAU_5244 [Streptomyces aurantiacus JA 4570]